MNKLSLKLDDLRVDTFTTSTESATGGTVMANVGTVVGNTCAPSCPYTCGIVQDTVNCRAGDTNNCPACA